MNKVYKVVWNKAKNMYVVASELAKNSTKGCSTKKLLTLLIATGVMASGVFMSEAQAASYSAGGGSATGAESIAIGNNAKATGNDTLAIGNEAFAGPTITFEKLKENIIAKSNGLIQESDLASCNSINDLNAKWTEMVGKAGSEDAAYTIRWAFEENLGAYGNQATAIGYQATATGLHSIAIGDMAKAVQYNGIAIGINSEAFAENNVVLGNRAAAATGAHSGIAIGTESVVGPDAAGGIAMGENTRAYGVGSTTLGVQAVSSGGGSTTVGARSNAEGTAAIALGYQASANSGNEETSIGAISVGVSSTATGDGSAAYGAGALAGVYSFDTVPDDDGTTGDITQHIADKKIYYKNELQADGTVKKVKLTEDEYKKGIEDEDNVINALAIGTGAGALANNAIAEGTGAVAEGENTIALGSKTIVVKDGTNSVAIGNNNFVNTENTFVLGNNVGSVDVSGAKLGTIKNSVYLGDSSTIADGTKNKKVDGSNGDTTTGGAFGTVNSATVYSKDTTTQYSVTYEGFAGATAVGAVSVGAAGAERRIQNVAAGEISDTSTDAINGSQLYVLQQEAQVHNTVVAGDDTIRVKEQVNASGGIEYSITTSIEAVDIDEHIKFANGVNTEIHTTTGTDSKDGKKVLTVSVDLDDNIKLTEKGSLTINNADLDKVVNIDGSGLNNGGNQITNVASGETGEKWTADNANNDYFNADTWNNAANIGDVYQIAGNIAGERQFIGDDGTQVKAKLGEEISLKGGADASTLTDGNIGVVAAADGKGLEIKLAQNIDLGDNGSVRTGDTTINNNGVTINNGPSITKNGVDAGNKTITNVKSGIVYGDDRDNNNAANIGDVKQLASDISGDVHNVQNNVNKLSNRVDKGLAGAAALAALHPLDFDPDDKLTFAAGIGNYKGQNAGAIGMFYRPDDKTMFSLGGTVGNGENMVNAGISFSLDRTNRVTNSKTAMAREILELREHSAKQDAQIAELIALVNSLTGRETTYRAGDILFPDVPENHWAYEYVYGLVEQGIIEGYPNGTFAGDRSMTRYEFSAMLWRALQAGVKLRSDIEAEFAQDLARFRVDRVHGEDGDKAKVERIRVNGDQKDANGIITNRRDHYGNIIPLQNGQ